MDAHAADTDRLTFPPIPLVTGTELQVESGETRAVRALSIAVELEDGDVVLLPLIRDHGVWWSPKQAGSTQGHASSGPSSH